MEVHKASVEKSDVTGLFESRAIQRHFYRAHACFGKYFLMIQKLQQIRKLAYIPSLERVSSGCSTKPCSWVEIWAAVSQQVYKASYGLFAEYYNQ